MKKEHPIPWHMCRLLKPGVWRNFCCQCGIPLEVRQQWIADKRDLVCDDCRPDIQTGNAISSAFSSDKRGTHA